MLNCAFLFIFTKTGGMSENGVRRAERKVFFEDYIKGVTAMEIIGKRIGEVFFGPGTPDIGERTITYAKVFENGKDFSAYYSAKEYLRNEGYESGSMYMNFPIGFIYKGKTGLDNRGNTVVVTKWEEERPLMVTKFDSFSSETVQCLDGVIIPAPGENTMREGDLFVVFFVFPD